MRLRDDERGQSVQIGAVMLFATLIIAFSSYQAFVVPQQNQEVEFNHNQQVLGEMQDLRNAIVSMPGGGSPISTSVTLGTTYPSRAVAQNPGPASGSLRTVGTENELVNLSIRNATASGETGDVWDGSARSYNTGGITYDPSYNRYTQAPVTVYEHSVVYNEFRSGTLLRAEQTMVDGRTLSLVIVNGSVAETSTDTTSVDVRPVSSSTETVLVSAPDGDSPVTLNFTSRLPASRWQELLSEEDHVRSVTQHPAAVTGPFHAVQIKLEPGVAYRLQLTKVGVGTRVTDEGAAYLTDVEGEGTSVTRGESRRLTLAVRDRFNNPVSDVPVNASVGPGKGSFADGSKSTDDDGEVTFEYRTTGTTATGTHRLNFTTNDSSVLSTRPFDQSRPENVSLNVTVTEPSGGGGGSTGAYTLSWTDPSSESANGGDELTSCSDDACTWDVGASDDDTLTLNSTLHPPYEDVEIDYAVSNSPVGTVSPGQAQTGPDGAATTELTARSDGIVTVLATTDGGSDSIDVRVENVSGGGGGGGSGSAPSASIEEIRDFSTDCDRNRQDKCTGGTDPTVKFEVDWRATDPDEDLETVTVELIDPDGTVVDTSRSTYGGTSSASETVTLVDDPGQWNGEYAVRVTATDAAGNNATVSGTEIADGN